MSVCKVQLNIMTRLVQHTLGGVCVLYILLCLPNSSTRASVLETCSMDSVIAQGLTYGARILDSIFLEAAGKKDKPLDFVRTSSLNLLFIISEQIWWRFVTLTSIASGNLLPISFGVGSIYEKVKTMYLEVKGITQHNNLPPWMRLIEQCNESLQTKESKNIFCEVIREVDQQKWW